jgi:LmbE family N-acetylglucosaminyl deacetylase
VTQVFLIEPHADDFLLSQGLAAAHYLGAGFKVHLVTMSPGGSGGVLDDLAGDVVCGSHGYRHSPVKEGYVAPLEADFHSLRLAESRAALGTLAAAITGSGDIEHFDGGLPTGFGGPWGSPPTADGVAQAKAVIKHYVDLYGNGTTFFHAMSPTDNHPDHAACGLALRELKNDPAYSYTLSGSRFFVSRLYWNDADVAAEGTATFPVTASRKAEYDKAVRIAAKAYAAWQPPQSLAVGYHQVINQFYQNGLDSQGNWTPSNSVQIECRWHD